VICVPLAAQTKVGTVSSVSGEVSIDAFGKNVFVAAIKGDVLYASSVLRTGASGRAKIEIGGATRDIPPGALVKVADLAAAGATKSKEGWLAGLGRVIRTFVAAAQKKEEPQVLGSRAADVSSEEADLGWMVEETDAEVALPEARSLALSGEYASALEKLGSAETPEDPSVAWDLSYWRGFCFYQLEDYGDAAVNLEAAYTLGTSLRQPFGDAGSRSALPFLLASSWYLLGKEDAAIPVLDAAVKAEPTGSYTPYSTLLLAEALAKTGNTVRSKAVAAEALKTYKGTELEADFAALAK